MNGDYITIKEAAEILGVSVQSIYKSKKYSQYIKIIDNKRFIEKSVVENKGKVENEEPENNEIKEENGLAKINKNAGKDLTRQLCAIVETLQNEIKARDKEIEELKNDIKEKKSIIENRDKVIIELSMSVAETNKRLTVLLRNEQKKNILNHADESLDISLNDASEESLEKPKRKPLFGIF